MLLAAEQAPRAVSLDNAALAGWEYSAVERLLWIRFVNTAGPRELRVTWNR